MFLQIFKNILKDLKFNVKRFWNYIMPWSIKIAQVCKFCSFFYNLFLSLCYSCFFLLLVIRYEGNLFHIERERLEHTSDLDYGTPWEITVLTTYGNKKNLLNKIIQEGYFQYFISTYWQKFI